VNIFEAWFRIIRPPIVFISCLGALIGLFNSAIFLEIQPSYFQMLMIILGAFFLAAGLMLHNDVTDLESDKINRPYKPLPSGVIGEKTAFYSGIFFMIISIIIGLMINIKDTGIINWKCGLLTLILVVVGLYYNHYGKYHGIVGNIAVAFGVGAIPFWGSIAAFPWRLDLMLTLAVALAIQEVGREIMVCAGDYKGDLEAGFKTFPVQMGRKKSMYVALIFYLGFIPLFPLPAYDYLNLGVPQVFGNLYLLGGTLLAFSLIITWFLTYLAVLKGDEKKIWKAFERYERVGTRTMIIVFQIFILIEIFY